MSSVASAARGVFVALGATTGRFTRTGRWLLFGTMLCYLAGFLWDRYHFLVVTSIVIPLVAVSIPVARASLRGVRIRVRTPTRVVAGRPFALTVEVHKRGGWVAARALQVSPPVALRGLPLGLACVPRGATARCTGRFVVARRGVVHLDNLRVSTRAPFGLYERTARVPIDRALIVHPAPARLRTLSLPPAGRLAAGIGVEQRVRGHDEFYGLREMRPGDRVRSICWRASARRGALVVREMRADAGHEVELIVHPPRGASAREVTVLADRAASVAAAIVDRLMRSGVRLRVEVRGANAGSVVVAGGARERAAALDLLARYGPGGRPPEEGAPTVRCRRVHVVPGTGEPVDAQPHDLVVPVVGAPRRPRW